MTSPMVDESLAKASQLVDEIFSSYPYEKVTPEHLFFAITRDRSKTIEDLFKILDLRFTQIEGALILHLTDGKLSEEVSIKNAPWEESTNFVIQDAQTIQEIFGDKYLGVEHVFCSLSRIVDNHSFKILNELGVNADLIAKAIALLKESNAKDNGQMFDANLNFQKVQDNSSIYETDKKETTTLGIDLTRLAQQGKLDPVIGRDEEIRRILNILTRRTKNNPVLIGEAGVGKTAIAEGLAVKLVSGNVPMSLRGYRLISIDVGNLVAGTGTRGAFEEKLTGLIDTAMSSGKNIILFIDELHLVVGAGATGEGALDAGNILKPYLARGHIKCIGATTHSEYSKYIEKDPALSRRFQKVLIDEPNIHETVSILRGLRDKYEGFHAIKIKDSALVAAANLSARYITDRQLPDKAVDLVDEAASRKRMEIDSTPSALDGISQELLHLELERTSLTKDQESGKRLDAINKKIAELEKRSEEILDQWKNTRRQLNSLSITKRRVENLKRSIARATQESNFRLAAQLEQLELIPLAEKIEEIESKENAISLDSVTEQDIENVVSELTAIPVSELKDDESKKLMQMEDDLNKIVIGQEDATRAVAKSIRISRTRLSNPDRPIGSFLFLGPTGVGKTELAKTLARSLFNDPLSFIRLDMSEYFDKYTVSRLIGAAPGYIGFDDGGQLTEAVKKRPYSCVLFDEIEKAHLDIYNILLQVLDEGRLTDSKGRVVDFKNTVVILTSNIASDQINEKFKSATKSGRDKNPKQTNRQSKSCGGVDALEDGIKSALLKSFKPELLNRIDDIVLFNPLKGEHLEKIVELQINQLKDRLAESGKELLVSKESIELLAKQASDSDFGARPVARMIRSEVQAPLSEKLLDGKFKRSRKIYMSLDQDKNLVFTTSAPKKS